MWEAEMRRLIQIQEMRGLRPFNITRPFRIMIVLILAFLIIKYEHGLEYYETLLRLHGLSM